MSSSAFDRPRSGPVLGLQSVVLPWSGLHCLCPLKYSQIFFSSSRTLTSDQSRARGHRSLLMSWASQNCPNTVHMPYNARSVEVGPNFPEIELEDISPNGVQDRSDSFSNKMLDTAWAVELTPPVVPPTWEVGREYIDVDVKTMTTATRLFHRILLATDFSSCSESAVPFAKLLAEHYDSKIVLAHIIPVAKEPVAADASRGTVDNSRDSAEKQMRRFLTANVPADLVSGSIIEQGPVSDVLARLIQERAIDLVVVGTHGRSGVGKLMMGSVAEGIFQVAPCPVLSVGRKSRHSGGRLARILYATDLLPASLGALPYALSLAEVTNAEVILLHVPEASSEDPRRLEQNNALHQRLNSLIPVEAKTWCRSDTLVIGGDPAEIILRSATEQNADFIVIGGHRVAGPLYAIQVPRTTAYKVVSRAHCPVLRVRS